MKIMVSAFKAILLLFCFLLVGGIINHFLGYDPTNQEASVYAKCMILLSFEMVLIRGISYDERVSIWCICMVILVAYCQIIMGYFLAGADTMQISNSPTRVNRAAVEAGISVMLAFSVVFIPRLILKRPLFFFSNRPPKP